MVLLSEFLLQQTPVSRVLPVWSQWWQQWPQPSLLANEPTAEVLRQWGTLGYPRRALRLHATATVLAEDYQDTVPADYRLLRQLPGVGDYTASAVLAFAFGQRALVLDTNVRRVLHRHRMGQQFPESASPRQSERKWAMEELPAEATVAAQWSIAVMELGSLMCTSRSPLCAECPIRASCRWRAAGYPPSQPLPRQATFSGSNRQVRGLIMAALRRQSSPVTLDDLRELWDDRTQLEACLRSLIRDGLAEPAGPGRLGLPSLNSAHPGPGGRDGRDEQ